MSDWGFGDPRGPGDQFITKDHLGDFCAFVEGKRENVTTKFGEDEATRCRYIVVITGDEAGVVYDDSIVFGNLGSAVYDPSSKIVLGTVVLGDAKPGRNAPYILEPATEEQKKLAGEWFDANAAVNSVGNVLIG